MGKVEGKKRGSLHLPSRDFGGHLIEWSVEENPEQVLLGSDGRRTMTHKTARWDQVNFHGLEEFEKLRRKPVCPSTFPLQ